MPRTDAPGLQVNLLYDGILNPVSARVRSHFRFHQGLSGGQPHRFALRIQSIGFLVLLFCSEKNRKHGALPLHSKCVIHFNRV